MIIWGMSGKGHDASLTVWDDHRLIYEAYTRDKTHHKLLKRDFISVSKNYRPDLVVWYENPYTKALRQLWARQSKPFSRNNVSKYLKDLGLNTKWTYVQHHKAHAAHYYQSEWNDAVIVVIDSIGEWDCTSVWHGVKDNLYKMGSQRYPDSLGLFYSSMVKEAGMKPQKDEAAFESLGSIGMTNVRLLKELEDNLIISNDPWRPVFSYNLHKGAGGDYEHYNQVEIASSTQYLFEEMVLKVVKHWTKKLKCKNVILSGGCAFNRGVRLKIQDAGFKLWVPDNPGDGGSAKSCVLAYFGKKTGFDISPNEIGVDT
ncbi:MAG: hypothetical protein CBB96_05610 [Gammaproteobacteria bacterium TMED36]|nr:MAG: hypothetical protein CBB96_08870 [Gammaproteobacteria bacterium TMED36]OUT94640.1 MAG: hypothetical protein CBB96_05610 [Gammaproteobacteria bacterium TMED36]|tara:strand:- start:1924 stop:2865 length:942 start_codon:yes stop_codon:yes gene_type:complete